MDRHMILYRGSLKSCNYSCSYCPFSKHRTSRRALERDREQWFSFIRNLDRGREALGIRALMIVPYGEALLHPWYWEGLARVSALDGMEAAGAQTNLSFSVKESLDRYRQWGGRTEKLRLWATFHPEMTSVSAFAEQCAQLREAGIAVSAGAVGVPENRELLRGLRRELPEEVYLWINRMDGLGRPYTREEEKGFLDIDPYFFRELIPVPADASECRGRLFVEGDGRLRICNIGRTLDVGWEALCGAPELPSPVCGQRRCSCFLAYGGRNDLVSRMLFGSYPLFRIPRRPKAVFLDIEGTLLTGEGSPDSAAQGDIPETVEAALAALVREGTALFFATTLPWESAVKRCRRVRGLFRGGIFAGGAHLALEEEGGVRECYYFLEEDCLERLEAVKKEFSFRALACRREGRLYKITLLRPRRRPWQRQEAETVFRALPVSCRAEMRYFAEGNCLQIVSAHADKASGVRTLCEWLHISPEDAFAAGDSGEDTEMTKLCGDGMRS